jgi:thiamine-phosphate diphosphorylase
MTIPRLHLATHDDVLAMPDFLDRATALMEAHGAGVAVHLRGHRTGGGALFRLAAALEATGRACGTPLLVNDRVDVALAVGCGAQLGRRSIPVEAARTLLGPEAVLGYSAHTADEAVAAVQAGADFIVLGTIWPTASHPGEPGAGTELVWETAARVAAPVIAIGGVTPDRAGAALEAGAHGVAVLSGVWSQPDGVAAAARYLSVMGVGT